MARASDAAKKTAFFTVRATPDEIKDFETACAHVGMGYPETIRQLAAAFVAQVKETGRILTPIKLVGPAKSRSRSAK